MKVTKETRTTLLFALAGLGVAATGWGQDATAAAASDAVKEGLSNMRVALDTVWVLVAGMLVFWMNAGFAMVESGLCRAKNCVNILAKNFIVFALATLSYWILGWGLMFGDGNLWSVERTVFRSGANNSPAWRGLCGDESLHVDDR
jgi:Amt family ammonium transporter